MYVSLSLINISEQEMVRQKVSTPGTEIDISHLEAGIYILRLQTATTVNTRELVVK